MAFIINSFNGDGFLTPITGSFDFEAAATDMVPTLCGEIDFSALVLPLLDFNRLRGAWVDITIEVVTQAQPPSFKRYAPADSNQFFPAVEVRYIELAGRVTGITQVRSSGVVLPQAHWVDRLGSFAGATKTLGSIGENVPVYVGVGGLFATGIQIYGQRGQAGLVNYEIWETRVGTSTDDMTSYILSCNAPYFTY